MCCRDSSQRIRAAAGPQITRGLTLLTLPFCCLAAHPRRTTALHADAAPPLQVGCALSARHRCMHSCLMDGVPRLQIACMEGGVAPMPDRGRNCRGATGQFL